MTKYTKKAMVSEETKTEALKIARATQKPGQTKEQTRLIAQGIQKGIEQYKKLQKAKSRDAERHRKKVKAASVQASDDHVDRKHETAIKEPGQQWLPWLLLGLSWVGFVAYLLQKV
ncbi:MAG: DUF2956 domain-containing protein [Pontibacterium sp.]